jgi:CBS domain-containing protein
MVSYAPRRGTGAAEDELYGGDMRLEQDLQAEQVAHLDLSVFTTAERGTPLSHVLAQMRRTGHGCTLVTQAGRLVGIFTERDALLKVIVRPETLDGPIDAVMTPDPSTVRPADPVATALSIMNRGHYRNVPVVETDGSIVGNLTHYAILKFFSDRFQQEVYNLPPDPDQVPSAPEGA